MVSDRKLHHEKRNVNTHARLIVFDAATVRATTSRARVDTLQRRKSSDSALRVLKRRRERILVTDVIPTCENMHNYEHHDNHPCVWRISSTKAEQHSPGSATAKRVYGQGPPPSTIQNRGNLRRGTTESPQSDLVWGIRSNLFGTCLTFL